MIRAPPGTIKPHRHERDFRCSRRVELVKFAADHKKYLGLATKCRAVPPGSVLNFGQCNFHNANVCGPTSGADIASRFSRFYKVQRGLRFAPSNASVTATRRSRSATSPPMLPRRGYISALLSAPIRCDASEEEKNIGSLGAMRGGEEAGQAKGESVNK